MDDLIPIEEVIEKNPRVDELQENGYIINLQNIEDYISSFEKHSTKYPSKKYWDKKRVLITGISGFAGSHLAEQLLELGCDIHGTIRRHEIGRAHG